MLNVLVFFVLGLFYEKKDYGSMIIFVVFLPSIAKLIIRTFTFVQRKISKKQTSGVNFINVPRVALACADPKKTDNVTVFCSVWYLRVKKFLIEC